MLFRSGVYLEISNGSEIVTIYRNIKAENKDDRLVKVFYSKYDSIGDPVKLYNQGTTTFNALGNVANRGVYILSCLFTRALICGKILSTML